MDTSNQNDIDNGSELLSDNQTQLVTFEVGQAVLALEISSVQEINRNLKLTHVPHAPHFVRGVTNLRGEVVTIFDLHIVLGISPADPGSGRNLIVNHDGELIGLCVDKISDIMAINSSELSTPPANLQGVPRKLIRGVYQAPSRLVMILDLEELLGSCKEKEAA